MAPSPRRAALMASRPHRPCPDQSCLRPAAIASIVHAWRFRLRSEMYPRRCIPRLLHAPRDKGGPCRNICPVSWNGSLRGLPPTRGPKVCGIAKRARERGSPPPTSSRHETPTDVDHRRGRVRAGRGTRRCPAAWRMGGERRGARRSPRRRSPPPGSGVPPAPPVRAQQDRTMPHRCHNRSPHYEAATVLCFSPHCPRHDRSILQTGAASAAAPLFCRYRSRWRRHRRRRSGPTEDGLVS